MKGKRDIVGYAVRESGGLRCWVSKRNKQGVFLDSSPSKARVYAERNGAVAAKCLLNNMGYKYKDGTPYHFEVVEVAV